ncbi:hypothetical protein LTR17_012420 [Elasticomyces elasticus]|nr:hypothetical protein LTR17_012420 [Elasticomyces elasticus]
MDEKPNGSERVAQESQLYDDDEAESGDDSRTQCMVRDSGHKPSPEAVDQRQGLQGNGKQRNGTSETTSKTTTTGVKV